MSATPRTPEQQAAEARRSKLLGRAAVIGLGLLVLAYVAPMFFHR